MHENIDTILSNLELDTYAKVTDITCSDSERRRLLDLGIVKGTKLKPIFKSPLGDPTAYEIRKSVIALREEDAAKIRVKESGCPRM